MAGYEQIEYFLTWQNEANSFVKSTEEESLSNNNTSFRKEEIFSDIGILNEQKTLKSFEIMKSAHESQKDAPVCLEEGAVNEKEMHIDEAKENQEGQEVPQKIKCRMRVSTLKKVKRSSKKGDGYEANESPPKKNSCNQSSFSKGKGNCDDQLLLGEKGVPVTSETEYQYPTDSNGNRIRRPPNSFILFSNRYRGMLCSSGTERKASFEVSKILGKKWRSLCEEDKSFYVQEAIKRKEEHMKMYPHYVYNPRVARILKSSLQKPKQRKKKEAGHQEKSKGTNKPQSSYKEMNENMSQPLDLLADLVQRTVSDGFREDSSDYYESLPTSSSSTNFSLKYDFSSAVDKRQDTFIKDARKLFEKELAVEKDSCKDALSSTGNSCQDDLSSTGNTCQDFFSSTGNSCQDKFLKTKNSVENVSTGVKDNCYDNFIGVDKSDLDFLVATEDLCQDKLSSTEITCEDAFFSTGSSCLNKSSSSTKSSCQTEVSGTGSGNQDDSSGTGASCQYVLSRTESIYPDAHPSTEILHQDEFAVIESSYHGGLVGRVNHYNNQDIKTETKFQNELNKRDTYHEAERTQMMDMLDYFAPDFTPSYSNCASTVSWHTPMPQCDQSQNPQIIQDGSTNNFSTHGTFYSTNCLDWATYGDAAFVNTVDFEILK